MTFKNSLLICSLCSLILSMSSCEGNTPNVKLENGHGNSVDKLGVLLQYPNLSFY